MFVPAGHRTKHFKIMSRIKIIEPQEAEGRLRDIYLDLEKQRGQIAEVHKIQSLRPESIVKHMDLYMEIMFGRSELSRAQREMMAVIVSVTNQCDYCSSHHGSALDRYWSNAEKLALLKKDFTLLDLEEKDKTLCEFAHLLTIDPGNKRDFTNDLRNAGFNDPAILDAALVVSYFNFVNRIVLSLGVELEQDKGENYKY